jgi:hypothetical protein
VVHVQTFVDGTETGYGDPDLSRQSTWTTRPSGRGDAKVEIYIDGELYKTFDVNFDNGTYVETTDLQALGEQLSQQGGSYGENTDEDYPEPQE